MQHILSAAHHISSYPPREATRHTNNQSNDLVSELGISLGSFNQVEEFSSFPNLTLGHEFGQAEDWSPAKNISCRYQNHEKYPQVIRISEPTSAWLERVVLPNQIIEFQAPANALLEVHDSTQAGSSWSDTLYCLELAAK